MAIYTQQIDILENMFYPTGMVIMWPSDTIPAGWLKCDGTAYSYTAEGGKYKALYDVIGTTYGEGTEGSSFKVPNMRDRFVEGVSSTHPLGTYVEAGLPNHSHTFTGSSVTSGTNGSHTHTRGTMEIEGAFNMNIGNTNGKYIDGHWHGESGAFSVVNGYTSTIATPPSNPYTTSTVNSVLNFTASKNWSGSLSYAGNHSHTFTAKGTIGNASANQAVYGKSTTVQPKSMYLNYIIRY